METTVTIPLSKRVRRMEESATLRMAQLGREVRAEGHDVISLSLGEPDFDTPEHIKDAAKEALDRGMTKYTPVPGTKELRQAISDKFGRENNLHYGPNQIVVSNGAKQSIANICMALLDEGDEAIILAPYWVSYSAIVQLAGGVPVEVGAGIEDDYKVGPEVIRAAITERTKFILFSSPCNPTGSVYTKEELSAIARMLADYPNVYVVADEIYEHINFTPDGHVSIGTLPEVADRTITVNGFSKGFAMTGWRLGYMGAPREIAAACAKLQGQNTSGANSIAQHAGAVALNSDLRPTQEMRAAFGRRRQLMIEGLEQIAGLKVNRPQGAFYIFPDVSAFFGKSAGDYQIDNADDLAEYLLRRAHVATVTGGAFGAPDCLRISYAAGEEQLREALRRISEVLGALS